MYTMGVDIGSTSSKIIILENGKTIFGNIVVQAGTGTSGPQQATEKTKKFNEVSVGTNINLDQLAPSPIGHEIRCIAKLVEQNKRKYVFDVTAYDEDKIIGKSTHTRYIVDLEKFTNKL